MPKKVCFSLPYLNLNPYIYYIFSFRFKCFKIALSGTTNKTRINLRQIN